MYVAVEAGHYAGISITEDVRHLNEGFGMLIMSPLIDYRWTSVHDCQVYYTQVPHVLSPHTWSRQDGLVVAASYESYLT